MERVLRRRPLERGAGEGWGEGSGGSCASGEWEAHSPELHYQVPSRLKKIIGIGQILKIIRNKQVQVVPAQRQLR